MAGPCSSAWRNTWTGLNRARENWAGLFPRGYLEGAALEALTASELFAASVRLTLTPGPASDPTLVVLVRPLSLPPEEHYRTGCRAVSVPIAITPNSPLRRGQIP